MEAPSIQPWYELSRSTNALACLHYLRKDKLRSFESTLAIFYENFSRIIEMEGWRRLFRWLQDVTSMLDGTKTSTVGNREVKLCTQLSKVSNQLMALIHRFHLSECYIIQKCNCSLETNIILVYFMSSDTVPVLFSVTSHHNFPSISTSLICGNYLFSFSKD